MKTMKKYMFLTLALLITAATGAWAQDKNNDCADNCPAADKAVQASRVAAAGPRKVAAEFGEAELSINCSTGAQYGVATDGEYIYTSNWGYTGVAETFFKYDLDGNFIEAFNIPDVPKAIRDMTYDGEYFYGTTNSNTVYIMDLENKTKIGTLTISIVARGITYDPERDGFWAVGDWSGPLALYDRDGNWIQNGIYAESVSGIAYYEDEDGEEHILQSNNGNHYVYDYNITTNTLGGAVLYLGNVPGYSGGSPGGCSIGEYNGQVCLFADIQQTPNVIGIVPIVNAKPFEDYDITGETGECFWGYTEDTKTLTIYGQGAMADYDDMVEQPWIDFAGDIETVIIKQGVTHIGSRAFHDLKKLTFVSIADGLESIGNYAFYDCWMLPFISIPASVTDMGNDAFWLCNRLRNVYLYGDAAAMAWKDTDCDDFSAAKHTTCHVVADALPWIEKFGESVNVTFVGDLKPIPEEYANEKPYKLGVAKSDFGKVTFFADGAQARKAEAGAAIMVKVAPEEGYIVDQVYGNGYIKWEQAASRAEGNMDLIKDLDIEQLKENVWGFVMPGADVEVYVTYRKLLTHSDITIDEIDAVEYDGEEQLPAIVVRDGENTLTEGEDYTLEFSGNKNAGYAMVVVRGIGEYAGETSTTFDITQKGVDGLTVEVAEAGEGEIPAITVKDGSAVLDPEYEYTISYEDADGNPVTEEQMAEGGKFKAVIDLNYNYSGTLTKDITVKEPAATGIASIENGKTIDNYYDLSGRKVVKAKKGVYVKNGKKVVIK